MLNRMILILLMLGVISTPILAQTFYNPIREAPSADPFVAQRDGVYYYLYTAGDGVYIHHSKKLHEVGKTPAKKVWGKSHGILGHVWAPELHYINGTWYIYASGSVTGKGDPPSMRMFVLKAVTADPLGRYMFSGFLSEKYAIDESVWQDPATGSLYMAWSQWDQNIPKASRISWIQTIYIAKMVSPTQLETNHVRLSYPTESWEKHGWWVNEAPVFIRRNNKLHIVMSVSGCSTPDYALALLTNEDGKYLNPSSWKKSSALVFMRNDLDGVWGPGHNSFAKSPDDTEDWIIYHAKSSSVDTNKDRSTRMQKFSWDVNDFPVFGKPVATSESLSLPSEARKQKP